MNMIKEIREKLEVEIRPNSVGLDYIEAVVRRGDIQLLESLLTKHLGSAAKEPGKEANFPMKIQRLVDSMGGLRIKQSFFFKLEDNEKVAYAALWPWESNPEKVTLKAGVGSL